MSSSFTAELAAQTVSSIDLGFSLLDSFFLQYWNGDYYIGDSVVRFPTVDLNEGPNDKKSH